MSKYYEYEPEGVCPKHITFELEDGKLHNVKFIGGCHGNLQAIPKLIEGEDAERVAGILLGNDCRNRGTSCADQLARAIYQALGKEA